MPSIASVESRCGLALPLQRGKKAHSLCAQPVASHFSAKRTVMSLRGTNLRATEATFTKALSGLMSKNNMKAPCGLGPCASCRMKPQPRQCFEVYMITASRSPALLGRQGGMLPRVACDKSCLLRTSKRSMKHMQPQQELNGGPREGEHGHSAIAYRILSASSAI